MTQEQLKAIGKSLAELIHNSLAWEEALDGDETADIAKYFLLELDELNGNK